jgi:hypothetical protein
MPKIYEALRAKIEKFEQIARQPGMRTYLVPFELDFPGFDTKDIKIDEVEVTDVTGAFVAIYGGYIGGQLVVESRNRNLEYVGLDMKTGKVFHEGECKHNCDVDCNFHEKNSCPYASAVSKGLKPKPQK